MTYQRLPYDDAATTPEMAADCAQVGRVPRFSPRQGSAAGTADRFVRQGTPVVPDDLAEMAAGLELHFD